jgi:predicted PhzF superfamily epimerase YddE/YHI9
MKYTSRQRFSASSLPRKIVIRQGSEARRPSEIFVRASRQGEKVTTVRVGGYTVEVLRGTVNL